MTMSDLAQRVTTSNGKLVYKLGNETLVVEPRGRDGLRVRATVEPEILDTEWALTEAAESQATIAVSEQAAVIRSGKISAHLQDIFTQMAHLQFFGHTGDRVILVLGEQDYVVHAHSSGTRIFKPSADGLAHSEVHFSTRNVERLYGMGLNATGWVDLKGTVIDLYERHVKYVVPFLVSSEGYGFLRNNPSLGRVELANNLTRWVSYGCRQVDYYITAGRS